MAKPNGVLICGFYGNYNLGDEAMLAGMMSLLRKHREDLSFTVFSNDPYDTKARYAVQSIHRLSRRRSVQRNLSILQNRYFILGGGDLLRDGATHLVAQNWLIPLQKALHLCRQTIVLGVSVGEIWRPETKALIPQVLNQVDLIAVRDVQSKAVLEALGVQNTIHVMTDLALQTLPDTFPEPLRAINQPLQIGVSVRHLSGRGPSVDVDQYPTLQKEIAAIVDELIESYGAIIHFLPFRTYEKSYHPTDDDYVSSLNVLRFSRYSSQCIVHRYFPSLQHLNQVISSLDLMIGMRLHSLILSAGSGVPVIAAEYDPKVKGFMNEIGQSEYSIPLDTFSTAQLSPLIRNILKDPSNACRNVQDGVTRYRKRILEMQPALTQLLADS